MNDDTIEMELPRWMVKQIRGKVREDKRQAITKAGEETAEEIANILTLYLDGYFDDQMTDTDLQMATEILLSSWKRERQSLSDKGHHRRAKRLAHCVKQLETVVENYGE